MAPHAEQSAQKNSGGVNAAMNRRNADASNGLMVRVAAFNAYDAVGLCFRCLVPRKFISASRNRRIQQKTAESGAIVSHFDREVKRCRSIFILIKCNVSGSNMKIAFWCRDLNARVLKGTAPLRGSKTQARLRALFEGSSEKIWPSRICTTRWA